MIKITYGEKKTKYGTGVGIDLDGEDVATAILAYLTGNRIHIDGPRTITVNGDLCREGRVFVDPSGTVYREGKRYSGRGPESYMVNFCELMIRTCKICKAREICRPIEGGWICQKCFEV